MAFRTTVSSETLAGAATMLRGLDGSNDRVGVIGFCSGGRQSVLAACHADLNAAVDCHGAFVTGTPSPDHPLQVRNLVADLPNLRCALLGLFGNEDQAPSPVDVDELQRLLGDHDKEFESFRYDNAGHAFMATDRPSYRPEAANDAWDQIARFFGTHVSEA